MFNQFIIKIQIREILSMNKIIILIACFFALTNALKRLPIKLENSQLDYHRSKSNLKHGKKYMNLIRETSR